VSFLETDRGARAMAGLRGGTGAHDPQNLTRIMPAEGGRWRDSILERSVSTCSPRRGSPAGRIATSRWPPSRAAPARSSSATPTKPEATPGGLALVRAISGQSSLPVVGIGGIDASNAPAVLEAGAAGVAVISAVAAAPDPIEATRELVRVVDHSLERRGG